MIHQVQNHLLVLYRQYHLGQAIVVTVLLAQIVVSHLKVQDHPHLIAVIRVLQYRVNLQVPIVAIQVRQNPVYRVNLQVPIVAIQVRQNPVDRVNQAIAVYHQKVVIVLYHLLVQ